MAELSAARTARARRRQKHGVACGAARALRRAAAAGPRRRREVGADFTAAVRRFARGGRRRGRRGVVFSRDARLDAADAARAPLWAALFDALASHEQWRPLLATAARLAPRPWFRSFRARLCDGAEAGARGALRRAGAAGGHAPARAGRGVVGRGSR